MSSISIDGGARAPTESVVAEGLEAAKPFIAALCTAQQELADAAAKPTAEYPVFPDYDDDVYYSVASVATDELAAALTIGGKAERDQRTDEIKAEVIARLADTYEGREKEISAAYRSLTKKLVRQRILTDHFRIDGRGITDIRALSAEVAVVPRAHGSALFERGETQILGVTTLDMVKMAQQIDSLGPEKSKRYMHHYNFPPFSTGETGRVGSPKRREIGHGALAERALIPVLPSVEEFPYAIRQVSEALSSNGSTSMGSVCASTLALLNAGVPLKAPVAGIAMGLVSDDVEVDGGGTERRFVTLTDILGAEDAFGDMDFKCAGTKDFVTALQLDTKLDGIPSQVLAGALAQAKDARLTILEVMAEAIDAPDEMSPYAPRVTTIKVPVDKIGEVIGPKGKMINSITEETGAQISIEDDGTVFVGATDGPSAQAAIDRINAIANPQLPTVGERFLGTVVKTTDFGAFVSLLPGRDGLVHISKLGRGKRIAKVEDVVNVGDKLRVEIAEIDKRGKISLVLVAEDEDAAAPPPDAPGDASGGRTSRCRDGQHLTPRPGHARSRGRPAAGQATAEAKSEHQAALRRTTLPGGPAGSHRVPARGAFRVGRRLGRCRIARRGCHGGRGRALPGAPAVQVDPDPHRGRHRAGDGRRRRRAERVHRQGAHLLLRARAGQRPGAGGRPGRRCGAQRSLRRRRCRAGTRRRPRGDRHARRRPRGRAGGHVPVRAVR